MTCATVDGLLMMELFAPPDQCRRGPLNRVRFDEADVADLIERYPPSQPPVFDEFIRPSDVEEIRWIVAEIEDRLTKQSQRFGPATQ